MTMHHKMGRAAIILAVGSAIVATASLAFAQEVGMRPGGSAAGPAVAVASPVVTDGRVTFRLRAADAKAVTVSGDFGPDVALTRDTEGVWSATVGPLKPDEYVYYFNVDVPPGYDANSRQRYPVLYLLHGFANDHHSWHRYGRANDSGSAIWIRSAMWGS